MKKLLHVNHITQYIVHIYIILLNHWIVKALLAQLAIEWVRVYVAYYVTLPKSKFLFYHDKLPLSASGNITEVALYHQLVRLVSYNLIVGSSKAVGHQIHYTCVDFSYMVLKLAILC